MDHHCGTCKFGQPTQDLNQLVCYGAPPTAIAVPAGPGQLQVQFVRPMVARNEKSCGAYKPKFLDVDYADIHQPVGQTDKPAEPAESLQHGVSSADGGGTSTTGYC